jgi:hypothetical protein
LDSGNKLSNSSFESNQWLEGFMEDFLLLDIFVIE